MASRRAFGLLDQLPLTLNAPLLDVNAILSETDLQLHLLHVLLQLPASLHGVLDACAVLDEADCDYGLTGLRRRAEVLGRVHQQRAVGIL